VEVRAGYRVASFDASGLPLDDWLGDAGGTSTAPATRTESRSVRRCVSTYGGMEDIHGPKWRVTTTTPYLEPLLQEIGMTPGPPGAGGSRSRSGDRISHCENHGATQVRVPARLTMKPSTTRRPTLSDF